MITGIWQEPLYTFLNTTIESSNEQYAVSNFEKSSDSNNIHFLVKILDGKFWISVYLLGVILKPMFVWLQMQTHTTYWLSYGPSYSRGNIARHKIFFLAAARQSSASLWSATYLSHVDLLSIWVWIRFSIFIVNFRNLQHSREVKN